MQGLSKTPNPNARTVIYVGIFILFFGGTELLSCFDSRLSPRSHAFPFLLIERPGWVLILRQKEGI